MYCCASVSSSKVYKCYGITICSTREPQDHVNPCDLLLGCCKISATLIDIVDAIVIFTISKLIVLYNVLQPMTILYAVSSTFNYFCDWHLYMTVWICARLLKGDI